MKHGIPCPACGSLVQHVVETRKQRGYIRRRRQCLECPMAFSTEERNLWHFQSNADETREQMHMLIKARVAKAAQELGRIRSMMADL
jgi:transcriptional regulator NrdR family protein